MRPLPDVKLFKRRGSIPRTIPTMQEKVVNCLIFSHIRQSETLKEETPLGLKLLTTSTFLAMAVLQKSSTLGVIRPTHQENHVHSNRKWEHKP